MPVAYTTLHRMAGERNCSVVEQILGRCPARWTVGLQRGSVVCTLAGLLGCSFASLLHHDTACSPSYRVCAASRVRSHLVIVLFWLARHDPAEFEV
jgi:hypothetical protein